MQCELLLNCEFKKTIILIQKKKFSNYDKLLLNDEEDET